MKWVKNGKKSKNFKMSENGVSGVNFASEFVLSTQNYPRATLEVILGKSIFDPPEAFHKDLLRISFFTKK